MRQYLKFGFGIVAGVLLACGMAAGIYSAQAQTTFPGPIMTTITLTTTASTQIIAANPTRKLIQICNTGASNGVWIAPGPGPAVANASIPLSALATLVATCYTSPPAPGIGGPPPGPGGNGAAWFAIAPTTNVTLTILEW
jgi:hypothetical protein